MTHDSRQVPSGQVQAFSGGVTKLRLRVDQRRYVIVEANGRGHLYRGEDETIPFTWHEANGGVTVAGPIPKTVVDAILTALANVNQAKDRPDRKSRGWRLSANLPPHPNNNYLANRR